MKIANKEIHFKSIAARWFVEVFMVIAVVLVLIGSILFTAERTLYYKRVESVASDYSREFAALADANSESYTKTAVAICESFEHKDKLEVQVLDSEGDVLVSTTGFVPENKFSDFETAANSKSGTLTTRTKLEKERVMTGITVFKNGEKVTGGYRYIVSLSITNQRIRSILIIIVLLLFTVLGLSAVSGFFFIKSIVRPIRDVGNIARKIAMGDMKTLIKSDRNDEIGELCGAIDYMATELQNADNLKNDFVSSVSHELRTPLTAIRGWGETAKMSIGTDLELVERGIDVVLSEADRLSGLVEELLDFSRMQQGRLTVSTAPIDVSELLRTVTDMYSELARQQGIEISYNPPGVNSIIMGDKDRLKQVFINIIDNAVKYTEKGGLVLIVQTRTENCVQIQIKDTGVGIPAKDIDHVKEKFYKANNTVRGSGIGLAVADEIMKQHNGLLLIESTEGVGTAVTVVLPLLEEEPEIELPPIPEETPAVEEILNQSTGDNAENHPEENEGENE